MRSVTGSVLAVLAVAFVAACSPASTPTTGAPTSAPTAARATGSPIGPADLALTASQITTNGSVGQVQGTLKVTVKNRGTAVPALRLEFAAIPVAIVLDDSSWDNCVKADNGTLRTVSCRIAPVPAGSTSVFTYIFGIKLGTLNRDQVGRVTVVAVGTNEADTTDNSANLSICTNGCGG
jgi:hypothetical protein